MATVAARCRSCAPGRAAALLLAAALTASGAASQEERGATHLPAAAAAPSLVFDPARSAGLFVGVRSFEDSEGTPSTVLAEIPYAVDDAVDLACAFSLELGLISPERVTLALAGTPQKPDSVARLERLRAAGATVVRAHYTNLCRVVQQTCSLADEQGLLVVSFATHGLHLGDGEDCLLALDSMAWNPRTTLTVRELTESTSLAKARRKLLLIDSCRERARTSRSVTDPASRLSKSFIDAIGESRGMLTLFAAPVGGYSYDDPDRRNGVFSGAFLEALHGAAQPDERGLITLGSIADHVKGEVRTWVARHRPDEADTHEIVRHGGTDLDEMPLAERREHGVVPLVGASSSAVVSARSVSRARLLLLVGCADGSASLWDAETGARLQTFSHGTMVRSVSLCGRADLVLTGGGDGTPRLWRAESGLAGPALGAHGGEVWSVGISSDGRRLVSGGRDGALRVWDAARGALLQTLPTATDRSLPAVLAVAFSADGQRILAGGGDRSATVWDTTRGAAAGALIGHTDDVMAVAFAADGLHVATGSADTSARIWSTETLKCAHVLPHSGAVWAVAFSPQGDRLLTGSADFSEAAGVWDVASGSRLMGLPATRRITCAGWSPDGRMLAVGGSDGVVKLFDAASGAAGREINTGDRAVMSLSF